jgi:hypothetical protein
MRYLAMAVWLLSVVLQFGASRTIAAQPVGPLFADLSFHFVCENASRLDVEKRVETFLMEQHFKVLNRAAIQRRYDVHIFDTSMVALDDDLRMVEMKSVPGADRRYSFYLYSRPPTNHVFPFEENILRFISENLQCQPRQIARKENEASQRELYDSEIRRVKNLFEEADRFEGRRPI